MSQKCISGVDDFTGVLNGRPPPSMFNCSRTLTGNVCALRMSGTHVTFNNQLTPIAPFKTFFFFDINKYRKGIQYAEVGLRSGGSRHCYHLNGNEMDRIAGFLFAYCLLCSFFLVVIQYA